VTSPEEEGRIDLCDFAVVNSSNNSSEVNKPCMDDKSEKSKCIPLSTLVGGKEGRNGSAPQAENFLGGVALHKGVEVSQLHPSDKSAVTSNFVCDNIEDSSNIVYDSVKDGRQTPSDKSDQLHPSDKSPTSTDRFVAGRKTQKKLSDATSPDKSLPRKVELIPRPVRNRQRPAKYDDFETKFVRMIRRPRDQGDEPTSPPDSRKRKVSFEPNRVKIESEMTELESENLTPRARTFWREKHVLVNRHVFRRV